MSVTRNGKNVSGFMTGVSVGVSASANVNALPNIQGRWLNRGLV